MQSPQTLRLALRIRKAREKRDRKGKLTKWHKVCMKVTPNIIKADGSPDTGLAYKIAYDGLEPEGDVRKRLGLRDICVKCKRPFRKPSGKVKPVLSPARLWWDGLKRDKQESILVRLYQMEGML